MNCLSTSCIFELLIDVTSRSCLSESWCYSKGINMPELNLYLCAFSLATRMMECYLCYTKAGLFQLFLNTAFKSWVYLFWRQGRGSLRLSIPTGLVKTTEGKVVCFSLPLKPQYWCLCLTRLKHQGPHPDWLLNTHTTGDQKIILMSFFLSISFLQPFHPTPSFKAPFGNYFLR